MNNQKALGLHGERIATEYVIEQAAQLVRAGAALGLPGVRELHRQVLVAEEALARFSKPWLAA